MFLRVFLCLFLSDDCRDPVNAKRLLGDNLRACTKGLFLFCIYRHSANAVTEMKRSGIEGHIAPRHEQLCTPYLLDIQNDRTDTKSHFSILICYADTNKE